MKCIERHKVLVVPDEIFEVLKHCEVNIPQQKAAMTAIRPHKLAMTQFENRKDKGWVKARSQ
jgi:hypothetical protein